MEDRIARYLKGAMADGMALGMTMAINTLAEARQHVEPENQTWESAIAFLRVVQDKWRAESQAKGEGIE